MRVGLKPWEFRRMTPAEFLRYIDAWKWNQKLQEDLEWQRTAWQTAYLLNLWLKDEAKVTPADLLRFREEPKEEQTPEQQVEIMAQWVAILGGVDKRRAV